MADEDAAAAFTLAGRAVELGYDLRLVCRELARVSRDLLLLSVDGSRVEDPEIAGEGERDRLIALASRFSREDLLRAFDLLTRAEFDIRERRAAALPPRDGAAALDPPAEADADRGFDCVRGRWSGAVSCAGRRPAVARSVAACLRASFADAAAQGRAAGAGSRKRCRA